MLKKGIHYYLKAVEAICVCLMLVILICMCIQISFRILNIGQNFTEELARLCFTLMIFVGAPLACVEGADIAVDMVVNMLPGPVRKIVDLIINIITAIFSLFCIKSLTVLIGSNAGVTAVSMTWIKMNWLYYAFMFSFACLFLAAAGKTIALIAGRSQTIDINAESKAKAKREEQEVDLGL